MNEWMTVRHATNMLCEFRLVMNNFACNEHVRNSIWTATDRMMKWSEQREKERKKEMVPVQAKRQCDQAIKSGDKKMCV